MQASSVCTQPRRPRSDPRRCAPEPCPHRERRRRLRGGERLAVPRVAAAAVPTFPTPCPYVSAPATRANVMMVSHRRVSLFFLCLRLGVFSLGPREGRHPVFQNPGKVNIVRGSKSLLYMLNLVFGDQRNSPSRSGSGPEMDSLLRADKRSLPRGRSSPSAFGLPQGRPWK